MDANESTVSYLLFLPWARCTHGLCVASVVMWQENRTSRVMIISSSFSDELVAADVVCTFDSRRWTNSTM